MIGVLHLAMGNLRSVGNALTASGRDWRPVEQPAGLDGCTHLIVPGVGAFRTACDRLAATGLDAAVRAFAASGRPVLGVCLGMQLLATTGDEGGPSRGLDLIPGHVARLSPERVATIPHVGWNDCVFARRHPVLARVRDRADFYFVHSYHFAPADPASVVATTDCGQAFASVVARGNVVGTQFHPEKSQGNGLRILEDFSDWDGRC